MKCELCGREILAGKESSHHLIPKCRDGKYGPVAILHEICHKQIHALFDEKMLSKHYNTIEKLKARPDIVRFIKWIRKKDPGFNIKARRADGRNKFTFTQVSLEN